ncbi:hypothetical protein DCAR_0623247 [Daucus carota subsp. sativus]|uniref:Reverse transcriptase domain-containing protein n=1 Tax=Daucus carota subsp. sativus TaxID=79200 RepID=A0AAF1B4N0_DAUCS|nr:hypothetical protein DCAR_0623247 [Daucus carota subsp. sativus]
MKRAESLGLIKGIKWSQEGESITHLQFADDTIVFLQLKIMSICNLKTVLQILQLVSDIIGCKQGEWPLSYLGAKLGSNPRRKVFWKLLVDKCKDKLSAWKCCSLNQAGRTTLIKSVFNSIPIYWFQIYKIPKGIRDSIDKLRRGFFLGEIGQKYAQDRRKLHLINWKQVCMPKCKGGLGIGNLKARNHALLLKWWWRWFKDIDFYWWRVIKNKYNLLPYKGIEKCASREDLSYITKDICSVKDEPWRSQFLFVSSIRWQVRNGESVFF